MKIKKVIFTFTGETRPAKRGEWIKSDSFNYVYWNNSGSTHSYEIYTMEETEEDWQPKKGELVYIADPLNLYYYSLVSSQVAIERNLCYPHTEQGKAMAIAHAKRMLEVGK